MPSSDLCNHLASCGCDQHRLGRVLTRKLQGDVHSCHGRLVIDQAPGEKRLHDRHRPGRGALGLRARPDIVDKILYEQVVLDCTRVLKVGDRIDAHGEGQLPARFDELLDREQ